MALELPDCVHGVFQQSILENGWGKKQVILTSTSRENIKGFITLEEFRGIIGEQQYQLLASMNADHTKNEDLALLKNLYDEMQGTHNAHIHQIKT
jgi:hypothetical protein